MNDYQKKKLCELAEVGNLDIPDKYKVFHKAREAINKAGEWVIVLGPDNVSYCKWESDDAMVNLYHTDHGSEIKSLEACLLEIIGKEETK